ncbi:MAG: putative porin [Desulfobulbaceae bacterium]|nr:putative porin [Desulfobulbaceae bacterium]
MRKVLSAAAALGLCLALPAAALAGAGMSDEQILKELEYLRNKVASQQEHIDALGAMVDKKVSAKVEEEVKKSGGSKVALANKFIDQLTLKGDLRARYEIRDRDYKDNSGSTDVSRDRWRTRFRLGGVWDNKEENWQVGAGLATGSDDPTSTNDTWSEDKPFETGDIRLDYAYAKHKWNDFSFTLGQHENPYKSSWVFWDGDVRLAGLTGHYGAKEGVFATVGGYSAKLVNDDNTATLVVGQAGYNGKAGEAAYTLAAGYHTYSKSLINEGLSAFSLNAVDEDKYELNIGDLYGKVSFPAGPVKLSLYGQLWQNFGADGAVGQSQAGSSFTQKPEDADMGWVLGGDATYGAFKLGYAYSVVEADSLFGYLSDSDFGDGLSKTNKKGHRVQAGYAITKNWSADVTWLSFERDEDYAAAKEDQVDIYQFDVSYKF